MSIKAIITGATGMIGEGVLHESLKHPDVESVLVIGRKTCGMVHPKLKELIHQDFADFSSIQDELKGYNAAFLCMGVSSAGMKEEKYKHLTYDLTMALAQPLQKLNPEMTLCYVSGAGTDSSETGRAMWGRVKGKTENDLLKMSFKGAYMFRPAFIQPTPGLKNSYMIYRVLNPITPLLRKLFPKFVHTLEELSIAIIKSALQGYEKSVLEVADIVKLSKSNNR